MKLEYLFNDESQTFMTRGHVPFDDFMAALEAEVGQDDPFLEQQPKHVWLRAVRDFEDGGSVYTEAKTGSRGAFKATWVVMPL